jgi:hypothetical protein
LICSDGFHAALAGQSVYWPTSPVGERYEIQGGRLSLWPLADGRVCVSDELGTACWLSPEEQLDLAAWLITLRDPPAGHLSWGEVVTGE